jgi:hypothetical protein
MDPTRLFAIISLVSLPTVMFGGLSLRRLLESSPGLTEFQRTYFRAGHAHAGVLLVLSLIYYDFFDRTTASDGLRWVAYIILAAGILAQSGGFFLHMATGEPNRPSVGTLVSTIGALLLATAVVILVYALIAEWP